jgi:hypothetical protein
MEVMILLSMLRRNPSCGATGHGIMLLCSAELASWTLIEQKRFIAVFDLVFCFICCLHSGGVTVYVIIARTPMDVWWGGRQGVVPCPCISYLENSTLLWFDRACC